jgi:hypothetical protein
VEHRPAAHRSLVPRSVAQRPAGPERVASTRAKGEARRELLAGELEVVRVAVAQPAEPPREALPAVDPPQEALPPADPPQEALQRAEPQRVALQRAEPQRVALQRAEPQRVALQRAEPQRVALPPADMQRVAPLQEAVQQG